MSSDEASAPAYELAATRAAIAKIQQILGNVELGMTRLHGHNELAY